MTEMTPEDQARRAGVKTISSKGPAKSAPLDAKPNGGNHTAKQSDVGTPPPGAKKAEKRSSGDLVKITEDGAALDFADLHQGELLYDHDAGAWYRWTGSHWKRERTGLALEWARQLARGLGDGPSIRRTSFAYGVERFARIDRTFAVTADCWDPDPFLLGTLGGTVDLRTGLLRSADPADKISRLTSITPAKTSDCPLFKAFFREATGEDEVLVRFLQQFFGYSLTGLTIEHALVFIWGGGGNGKTVLLNTVSWVFGDYAKTAAMDAFIETRGEKHTTDVAMLHGARLVVTSEIARGRFWNENLLKQLTGGEDVTARFMRQDNFTFRPTFKLAAIGNHKPRLRSVNEAVRRRFNIIPLDQKPSNPDKKLEVKLHAEGPAILRWLIEGCLDWQANGLVHPPSVLLATDDYFETQDLFSQWLEEECDVEPGNDWKRENSGALFASWAAYAKRCGEDVGSKVNFSDELKERGFVGDRGHGGVRRYKGIRLKPRPGDIG